MVTCSHLFVNTPALLTQAAIIPHNTKDLRSIEIFIEPLYNLTITEQVNI